MVEEEEVVVVGEEGSFIGERRGVVDLEEEALAWFARPSSSRGGGSFPIGKSLTQTRGLAGIDHHNHHHHQHDGIRSDDFTFCDGEHQVEEGRSNSHNQGSLILKLQQFLLSGA